MVCASSDKIFDSPYSGTAKLSNSYPYRTLTFYGRLSHTFRMEFNNAMLRPVPRIAPVWAPPLSLAATDGIR